METFGTNYAKAVDDLSTKIFIPALICSLWVEFGPFMKEITGFGMLPTYLLICVIGASTACLIMYLKIMVAIFIFKGRDIGPEIGVILMPLGLAGLFPEQFHSIDIPYSQVTGVALLAWSFILIKGKTFFQELFW